jgi:hypothetical protein
MHSITSSENMVMGRVFRNNFRLLVVGKLLGNVGTLAVISMDISR